MRGDSYSGSGLNGQLAGRIARMSGGSQRWLKTALQTIAANDEMLDVDQDTAAEPAPRWEERPDAPPEERQRRAVDLEDVLSGKVSLESELADYPELAEEMDGLGDIIDMLRDAGKRRRERGEDILREELLGDESDVDEGEPRTDP